jgi:hypothetical protein
VLPNQNHRIQRGPTTHHPQRVPPFPFSNKIFLALAQSPQSIYRETFSKQANKKMPVEPSCKPQQKYTPAQHKLKYKTEYNDEFVGQKMPQRSEFECLSREELKQYVMTILQE